MIWFIRQGYKIIVSEGKERTCYPYHDNVPFNQMPYMQHGIDGNQGIERFLRATGLWGSVADDLDVEVATVMPVASVRDVNQNLMRQYIGDFHHIQAGPLHLTQPLAKARYSSWPDCMLQGSSL